MIKRGLLTVVLAAVLLIMPVQKRAQACPDVNGLLVHCAAFQAIATFQAFYLANLRNPALGLAPPPGAGLPEPDYSLQPWLDPDDALMFNFFLAVGAVLPQESDNDEEGSSGGYDKDTVDRALWANVKALAQANASAANPDLSCGATGDCSSGPVGQIFGGGPNSGYLCDSGSSGCGSDGFIPSVSDNFGECSGGGCGATPANLTTIDPSLLFQFDVGDLTAHPYGANLTSGAFDPFGGGAEDSYINPRTGQTVTFDPTNPPDDVLKARALSDAYARGEINYPFYDPNWETRPISDFDPQQGNLGGIPETNPVQREYGLMRSDPVNVRTSEASGNADSGDRDDPHDNYIRSFLSDSPVLPRWRISAPPSGTTNPVATPRPTIAGERLTELGYRDANGNAYTVDVIRTPDGRTLAVGTGENAGHVFGEAVEGEFGYRREGPWTPPPTADGNDVEVSKLPGKIEPGDKITVNEIGPTPPVTQSPTPSAFKQDEYYISVSIANSDREDMSPSIFADGFESGDTTSWSVTVP